MKVPTFPFAFVLSLLFVSLHSITVKAKTNSTHNAYSRPDVTHGLFEGDIKPTWRTINYAYGEITAQELVAKGIITDHMDPDESEDLGSAPGIPLWKDDFRTSDEMYHIPVFFSTGVYTTDELAQVKQAIRRVQNYSGVVKFDWIDTMYTDGTPFMHVGTFGIDICASYVGKESNLATSQFGQFIWIGKSCITEGLIQQEMLHALGFFHEHTRPDRDTYVTVYPQSILAGEELNFAIRTEVDSLGSPYDYDSLSHFGEYEFSSTGAKTMDAFGNTVGQKVSMSLIDKIQMRLMYQCGDGSTRTYNTHQATKCTTTCKCGKNKKGCRENKVNYDSRCKGDLVCKNNRCKKP